MEISNYKRFFGVWDDESELFAGYKLEQYNLPAWTDSLPVMAHDFAGRDGAAEIIASIREVLYARYSGYGEYGTDYEMWARVLFVAVDGKLYEVHASHCSCYGLEDQWKPSEVSAQDILADLKMGGNAWDAYAADERFAIAIGLAGYIAPFAEPSPVHSINGVPIYHLSYCSYVRISETPALNRAILRAWMRGQTMPVIDGIDPQDAIYLWDYRRFLSGGEITD